MLNGKFYTGLPEKMMNRGPNGVDRQRTNMYWPEEEHQPSVYEYSPSRNVRRPSSRASSSRTSSISYDSQNGVFDDVNTRELVRKQQESKIQFYDYDETHVPPSRTITPSSVARNLSRESPEAEASHRKLETLKSRIEFYDFVDAPEQEATPRSRRTSGHQPLQRRESETRSPEAAVVVNSRQRDNDNFAQETYAREGRTDGRAATASTRSSTSTTTTTINHDGRAKTQNSTPIRRVPVQVNSTRSPPPPDQQSPRPRPGALPPTKKQLSSSVIDLSTLDLDDPELEELKKLRPPSKTDIHRKLATFETEIRTTGSRSPTDSYPRSPPPRNTATRDSPTATNQVNGGMRHDDRSSRGRDPIRKGSIGGSDAPEAPNEARRMAHRHLQSSFSFGSDGTQLNTGERRPFSVRDSAVCRVGVGLPDIYS